MDISAFIPTVDTVDVELKNPVDGSVMTNKDGSPMTITMYLPHSKKYKEVRHAQTNKRIQEGQKKNKKVITAEEIEAETLDLLVKTTAGWNITYKEKQPKFSDDLAREIYELAPFIPEQLFEGVAEAEVFTKN
jgi:hypothetical protein